MVRWRASVRCGVVDSVDCSPDRGQLASPPEPEVAPAATTRHQLRVDYAERNATLPDLVQESDDFAIHLEQLEVGDYVVDGRIIVERKTYADFATSLVDGCSRKQPRLREGPIGPSFCSKAPCRLRCRMCTRTR